MDEDRLKATKAAAKRAKAGARKAAAKKAAAAKSTGSAKASAKKSTSRSGRTTPPKVLQDRDPFEMSFDIGTIKHLGLQMYSTLPPVISELVSNAWDANATKVTITIPTETFKDDSEIVVQDNGSGMDDTDVRKAYMKVGRDRRADEGVDRTPKPFNRPIMGRKGIGKFAGFGIAVEVEVESVKNGQVSRWIMNYHALEKAAGARVIEFPPLAPTGEVTKGTRVTLRKLTRFRTRRVNIQRVRRGIARRFSVIGTKNKFQVVINTSPITVAERELQRLLDKDDAGRPYLWTYEDEEIVKDSGWKVSGWIGALDRTAEIEDGIQRGIVIMARGKLVQEPFVFDATVGQQFALSYLVGEITAEFVDEEEDTIGTTRNSLVWDTEANQALQDWGAAQVNKIAREWAEKRRKDNESALSKNPLYKRFKAEAANTDNKRAIKVADKLIREVVGRNVVESTDEQEQVVQLCLDFLEFDAFWDLAEEITDAGVDDPGKLVTLFRDWEIVEAKEMSRVTAGRIATISKLQKLIDENALEVPTLHNFLKEFPWVLDPRWTLIADEKRYSDLLKEKFPEGNDVPESDRRIDFLCVKENQQLIVVEIKRPQSRASRKELDQIRDYVAFMRDHVATTTDPEFKTGEVLGYLLCGDIVITGQVREQMRMLESANIYVRRYGDLLGMVERTHKDFLDEYERLRALKAAQAKGKA